MAVDPYRGAYRGESAPSRIPFYRFWALVALYLGCV